MRVLLLGAGQDVGRSCVVVRIGGKTVMLDCGMHMGYQDARRFPDFSLLSPSHDYTSVIDAVLISHFHVDHIGALPYFTEVCGYNGPVFMTYPTRAIAPLMLHDFHRVLVARPGTGPLFAARHIDASMSKVRVMDLHETVEVCEGVEVTPYYAGHVLGAAMLHIRVGSESLVYTGDFNTVPERHLAGASIRRLCPDLLITESTYATSIREDRRSKEQHLLNMIHQTITSGGKVLVPVFAVGRAQELLMLLIEHWQRTQLEVPIYMSSSLATRANSIFKLLQNWASERVKQAVPGCRAAAFNFSRVQDWTPDLIHAPGACVLFATPGMLHGGTSLDVFKAWAPDPKNLVLLPSYQVAGTVGRKLLMGVRQGLQVDAKTQLDVRCKVEYAALSAHTDAKGILQVVQQVAPAAVMLVHGEPDKMSFMSDRIQRSLNIPCFTPANGEEVQVTYGATHHVPVSAQLLKQLLVPRHQLQHRLAAAVPQTDAQDSGLSGSAGRSVSQTVAGWIEQGNVKQLAAAAMRLSGVVGPEYLKDHSSEAPLGDYRPGQHQQHLQQQNQQQLALQVHGTMAAAKAAQLAPWLELLAAAAQDVQQRQQGDRAVASHDGGSADGSIGAEHGSSGVCKDKSITAATVEALQSHPLSVAAELLEQVQVEERAVAVDGILLVYHGEASSYKHTCVPAGGVDCQQQQQQPRMVGKPVTMALLPAEAAAASLQMQQHKIRLSCKVHLPGHCSTLYQEKSRPSSLHSEAEQHPDTCQPEPQSAEALFILEALVSGLPPSVASKVQLAAGGFQVQLRSINWQHAAEACQLSCWKCSWLIEDDPLAQRCVAHVQQAALPHTPAPDM